MLYLTDRRKQVLLMCAQGFNSKAIARKLNLSEHTANDHKRALLNYFGVSSMTHAVYLASKQGVI